MIKMARFEKMIIILGHFSGQHLVSAAEKIFTKYFSFKDHKVLGYMYLEDRNYISVSLSESLKYKWIPAVNQAVDTMLWVLGIQCPP